MKERITVATWITLCRLGLVPLFAVALVNQQAERALLFFSIACLSDTFDGWVARRFQQATKMGALLDALADKLLLTLAYLLMSSFPGDLPNVIPWWLTLLVIGRDIFILAGAAWLRLRAGIRQFAPSWWGKWSTTLQMFTVALALLANALHQRVPFFPLFIYATCILTLVSGLHYLQGAFIFPKPQKGQ